MNYRITSLSFTFIFICIINAMLPGSLIPYMIMNANTSLFICILISFILGLVVIHFFFKVFDYLPEYSLYNKINYLFPKFISKLLVFIILLFTFIFGIFVFWRYSTLISLEFLVETPNFLIVLILILPIIYTTLYDMETIAKVSTFCIFVGGFLFINNTFSLIKDINLSNFLPILNDSIVKLSKNSIIFLVLNVVPILSLLVIPKDNVIDKEKVKKSVYVGYIINSVCITLIFVCTVGVLGINLSRIFTFPSYEVLKTINMFSFLDNIENINILIWVLFMTLCLAYNIQAIKIGLYEVFNVRSNRKQIISLGLIIVLLISIVIYLIPYENYLNKSNVNYIYVPFILLCLSIIIVSFVYIYGKISKK